MTLGGTAEAWPVVAEQQEASSEQDGVEFRRPGQCLRQASGVYS